MIFLISSSHRLFSLGPVSKWSYAVYYSVSSAPLHPYASQSHRRALRVCEFLLICCINFSSGKRMIVTSSLFSSAALFSIKPFPCLVCFFVSSRNPLFLIHTSLDLVILVISVAIVVNSFSVFTLCCGLCLCQSFLPTPVRIPRHEHLQYILGPQLLFTEFFYSLLLLVSVLANIFVGH